MKNLMIVIRPYEPPLLTCTSMVEKQTQLCIEINDNNLMINSLLSAVYNGNWYPIRIIFKLLMLFKILNHTVIIEL